MPRTTEAAVKALMLPGRDYNLMTNPSLLGFIDTASSMIDDAVELAALDSVVYSDRKLELLERWVAAWAHCMSSQQLASSSSLSASGSRTGQTAMGLEANFYGQTALRLDANGYLEQLDKGVETVSIEWLGKRDSERISYEDRNN